ncbi:hypothetical protein CALCODRAFT_307982 [Calocera cornea HHB12733]|uniref:Uncharacterized protein n=1 Tax=Calocera cornea HHB12733 TaxID=1353952 RepID=A0A165JNI1_9BASI|nr:hypothetical protein CALCODRAFT_307982 [Calocera cornea HHB12733]
MDQPSTSAAGRAEAHKSLTGILRPGESHARRLAPLTIPIPEEPVQTPAAFHRLVRNFTLVPALSILEFVIAAVALLSILHRGTHQPDLLAILVAIAFWSFSHHLGPPLFRIFDGLSAAFPSSGWSETVLEALSTLIHVAIKEFARFTAVFIVYKAGHPDLIDLLWLGFGWALGDVTCGIYQNYLNLYQYHEGPLPNDDPVLSAAPWSGYRAGEIITSASTDGGNLPFSNGAAAAERYEALLDVELGRLASLKARLELEDIYGIPFADIPPIIISVQWLDALLLSLGLTLIMSHPFVNHGSIRSTIPVVAVTWAIHSCLALGYALAMPKIGVHAVNYFGLMVSIGCLVAGLAQWGVLE